MEKFYNLFNANEYISIALKNEILNNYQPLYQKYKKNIFYILFREKRTFIKNYLNIDKLVEHNNNRYIMEEAIKHTKLLNNIKGYSLDDEQKRCVLSDEKASLIIAGAGSGKSLTIIAKIRYLIETKFIEENEILCISFTKESSNKLKNDLKITYNYDIDVYTFHKLSHNILNNNNFVFSLADEKTLNYIVNEFYDYIIYDYPIIKNLVTKYFFGNKLKQYNDIPNSELIKFKKIITNFISLYKANIYNEKLLFNYLKKVDNKNYLLLMNIIIIYKIYNIELQSQLEIDFDDLIIKATEEVKKNGINKNYKYIIIDEYQDTSIIRVNLIKEIINKLNCKLIVVGDDFQSIYKFSGCNIDTFLKFNHYFNNAKTFFIQNNYRNSQEVIDVAGKFVMKNQKQLKKKLQAHKSILKPIKIIYYQNQKEAFNKLIKYLMKQNQNNILILGRNNNDINKIVEDEKDLKNYNINLKYLTVHKSKGLEEDNIVIINLENRTMGFPSKLEFHPITKLIYDDKEYIKYEEERRLFYVALTRSKNYVYLLVDEFKPSIFIKEIMNDYPNNIEILSIK